MDGVVGGSQVLGYAERRREPSGLGLTFSHASSEQIILALGNYMNSSKRGAVYGFKLQSLDLVRWWGQHGARKPVGQWLWSQGA